jgi:hypothetical protein
VVLSVQEVLGCGVGSCKAGDATMVLAFGKNRPLLPESCQHYQGRQLSSCETGCASCSRPLTNTPQDPSAKDNCSLAQKVASPVVRSYSKLSSNPEELKKELLKGPFVCGIEATEQFRAYPGGLLQGEASSPAAYNHYVEVLGLGVEGAQEYWLARNSYGLGWGENGFFRALVGKNVLGMEKDCYSAVIE